MLLDRREVDRRIAEGNLVEKRQQQCAVERCGMGSIGIEPVLHAVNLQCLELVRDLGQCVARLR
jgi:hypothetical protein